MDQLIEKLLEVQRQLRAELAELPQILQEIEHLLDLRYGYLAQSQPVRSIPPGRLLCEIVHEAKALDVWENEGGRLPPDA
jgi:hypothetical protein